MGVWTSRERLTSYAANRLDGASYKPAFMFVVDKLGLKTYHSSVGVLNVHMLEIPFELRGINFYKRENESFSARSSSGHAVSE